MDKPVYIQQISAFPESLFPDTETTNMRWEESLGWVRSLTAEETEMLKTDVPQWMKHPDKLHKMLHKAAMGLPEKPDLIMVGSSRGATESFEQALQQFQQTGDVSARVSPKTTAGSISSLLAQQFQVSQSMEVSQTCSSGLQAILNGMAWLKSGMAQRVWAGAGEAPLTPFTVQMLKKTGILWTGRKHEPPVAGKGIVLAEAAVMAQLGTHPGPLRISGWGAAMDKGITLTGLSQEGLAYQAAMQSAIEKSGKVPDLILMHAPGTAAGDAAEQQALHNLFGETLPVHWSSKSFTGHALGAAGMVSLYIAWKIAVERCQPLHFPVPEFCQSILINAMGFGGNAISIMVEREKD